MTDDHCYRCGRLLTDPRRFVMLELGLDGRWRDPRSQGSLPLDQSQGGFLFGRECARAQLEEQGNG